MSKFRIAAAAIALIPSVAFSQTVVTPTNLNGWALYDGAGPGTKPATITAAQPFNGDGSLQFTVSASNQQPSAGYGFSSPVALASLTSFTFGYTFLTPLGTVPAASPTLRLLLTGITGANQSNGRSDGSFGWYLNGSSNAWQTASLSNTNGNVFFRVGGVGQEALDCKSTGSSFDDRRQTVAAFLSACNGVGGAASLLGASIVGVQVDFGTFVAANPASTYADMVNFSIGTNTGNYNFELAQSTVPEPSTYALMAAGLVTLGLVARRRRRQAIA